jgi:hypothetical protein
MLSILCACLIPLTAALYGLSQPDPSAGSAWWPAAGKDGA